MKKSIPSRGPSNRNDTETIIDDEDGYLEQELPGMEEEDSESIYECPRSGSKVYRGP